MIEAHEYSVSLTFSMPSTMANDPARTVYMKHRTALLVGRRLADTDHYGSSPSLALTLISISATSGVSTSSAPNMAADPGEPMGSVLPGKVAAKNAALSSRYALHSSGRSSS